jgi:transcriptional regulator with PAS, ATPase and Fis domain
MSAQQRAIERSIEYLLGPAIVCVDKKIVWGTDEARTMLRVPRGMPMAKSVRLRSEPLAPGRVTALSGTNEQTHGRVLDVDKNIQIVALERQHLGKAEPTLFHGMWSRMPAMLDVFRMIQRVSIDDETVLVRGETGTGKELVAQAIHRLSPRAKGPFRAINCAALPANLLESELFGHARGAFTGALKDTMGHVQLAHRGTLFLDEVAELPLELQAKLLRVLETHSVIPVGAREPIPIDVRIISATHRALRKEVEAGRFRADLMYRLRVIPIFLPPLRERIEDVALLTDKIVAEMNPTRRRKIEIISPPALRILENHLFPGNVRELRNILSFAYAMGDGPVLMPADLPRELTVEEPMNLSQDPMRRAIESALRNAGGNRHKAAEALGLSRVTLWRRMKELTTRE